MRALLIGVLALALLWGGYWFVGSRALERGATSWFAETTARGLTATRDSLRVRGFPSRFDLTVEGLHLADPATGIGWKAPFVQIFSLSYKPWHLIAALPPEQVFETPTETITLGSARLQGSLVIRPNTDLALDRVVIEGEGLAARSSLGWQLAAQKLVFATRQDPGLANGHQIGLDITGLAPDPALIQALAGQTTLPPVIAALHLDASLGFTAPLDRHSADTRPRLASLTLHAARVSWGELGFFAKGSLAPGANGQAEGRIELRLENWQQGLAAAQALGLISPELAPTLAQALTLLSAQSGNPAVLELPLVFRSGLMSLGPFPLGPAPRLQ